MKCVVFDFDGVVIDSHELQMHSLKIAYEKMEINKEPPYKEFFQNSGDSLKNIFTKLKLPLSILPIYIGESKKNPDMIQVKKDMPDLLRRLKKNYIKCGLCTGKERDRTLEILEKFKLRQYFDSIVCSDDVDRPKPYPDSLYKILDEVGGSRNDSIMIGDGMNDILCAHSANIKSIAVTWGDTTTKDLLSVRPNYIVDTVGQLEDIIYGYMRYGSMNISG